MKVYNTYNHKRVRLHRWYIKHEDGIRVFFTLSAGLVVLWAIRWVVFIVWGI